MRMRKHIGIVLMTLLIIFGCSSFCAEALTTPSITIDPDCIYTPLENSVRVKGTLSVAKGQKLVVYAKDGKTILVKEKMTNTGKSVYFNIYIPASYANRPGETTVYVKSLKTKNVAASKAICVTIHSGIKQTIKSPSKVTLTNLKTTRKLKATCNYGNQLYYKSSAPEVVSVDKNGKLTRKKNGTATITIRQPGNDHYLPAKAKVKVTSRKSTCQEQINGAVSWAVKTARDNDFTHGSGDGAYHYGCYYCGTNYGPNKYLKPSEQYKKTYCANAFIHAAYAHGAKQSKMLEACGEGSGIDLTKESFLQYGCWKFKEKPAYKYLKKGDVMVGSSQMAMYIGD